MPETGYNSSKKLLVSASRTTTQTVTEDTDGNKLVNATGSGVQVILDVTSAGTGSITLTIDGQDAASGKFYNLLTGLAVITNSLNVYTIFPGATAVANVTVNNFLPKIWRVVVTHNNANPITYSLGANVLR